MEEQNSEELVNKTKETSLKTSSNKFKVSKNDKKSPLSINHPSNNLSLTTNIPISPKDD